MSYAYFLIFVAVEVSFDALCLFSAQNFSFHDWNSEVGSDFCCLYLVLQQYRVTFWIWLVFQNCQSGEQSYIHVSCSAHCLSVSCNYEYDKSIVSCIHLDRCCQFKYESRKVCPVQLKCFDNYVMFMWWIFKEYSLWVCPCIVLRILPSPGFHVLFFLIYLLSKLKLNHGIKKMCNESRLFICTKHRLMSIKLALWS